MFKISVVTPSVRKEMLGIVEKCLKRQTFRDFEWIIVGPPEICDLSLEEATEKDLENSYFYTEPTRKGDYYNLNKAWNEGFRRSEGELIVSIQDGLWFPPDILEKLWLHYQDNPNLVVGGVGNQYGEVINGKPENAVWQDPRIRSDFGSFYEIYPVDMEWTLVSFPHKAILDIGGLDEEYDKGAALSEKEATVRMYMAGYKPYLDQTIEYRAIKHERLSKDWGEKYLIAVEMWKKHCPEVLDGKRLKLNYL